MKAPSIKMHLCFSLVKSVIRITACIFGLVLNDAYLTILSILIAELVGIVEELF